MHHITRNVCACCRTKMEERGEDVQDVREELMDAFDEANSPGADLREIRKHRVKHKQHGKKRREISKEPKGTRGARVVGSKEMDL